MTNYYDENEYDFADTVRVGDEVPEFSADVYEKGEFKEGVSPMDSPKWKLLFFYPLDFTFICPTEILELSAKADKFRKLNCEPFVVSVDSIHAHKAWSEGSLGKLNVPMIGDVSHEITQMFDVENDDGVAFRAAFLIDEDNVLQSVTINNLNVGRNVDEILRTLEAFQTGDLCPVNWQKGAKTLGKA